MRVITGRYKGRKLRGPVGLEIRPTGDRLKESLFDILGDRVRDCVFLDVFAGTGAIGIEALSRGAREALFIENEGRCCRLIRQNLELCGASGGRVMSKEAFSALRALARGEFRPDFVFLDPPYNFEPYADLLDILFGTGLAGADCLVIIEHSSRAPVPDSGECFCRTRVVRQGDAALSFYRAGPQPPPEAGGTGRGAAGTDAG
jgi:16S rRNA (guanine(966)-N(2))-methyltransferase RsmD